jgi:hypothetical protein
MKRVVTHKSLLDQFCEAPFSMTIASLSLLGLVIMGFKKLFGLD